MKKIEIEKQAAGEIYPSGNPEFIRRINHARDFTLEYNALKSAAINALKRVLRELLGKVVTDDIPSGVLAMGVPCKVYRKLDEER